MEYAFITGATSGLGKDFSRLLAAMGYGLVLIGRRQDRLKYMSRFFSKKYGTDVITFEADLSVKEDIDYILSRCDEINIKVVVNCAGYGRVTEVNSSDIEDDLKQIDTNIKAVHQITSHFLKKLSYGYILNVASIAGFTPGPLMAEYGATKSYILNYSLAASYEMKRLGSDIHISVLCPGPLKTEFDNVAGSKGNINQMSSMRCAYIALNDMFSGKRLIIPGYSIKLGHMALKYLPYSVTLPIEYAIQNKKRK